MHELTKQQQLDNALELIKANGYTVTKDEPAKAWEPKEREQVVLLQPSGRFAMFIYTQGLWKDELARGNIFPATDEGKCQARATDKRRRLIAEAEREGMQDEGMLYYFLCYGEIEAFRWERDPRDYAYFRSGNYSRTKAGLEDKIARYGADVVEGRQ